MVCVWVNSLSGNTLIRYIRMKIIGIGKNYVNDASEMPIEKGMPVIFTKPKAVFLNLEKLCISQKCPTRFGMRLSWLLK